MKAKHKIPKRVAIVYNLREREFILSSIIRDEIRKTNKNIKVFIIGIWEMDFREKILKFAPDLIWTFPITTESQIIEYTMLKLLFNCCICCFTTEGLLDFSDSKVIETSIGFHRYSKILIDYECCWGKLYAETVSRARVENGLFHSMESVKIFGNPMYEKEKIKIYGNQFKEFKEMIVKKNEYERTVMFLTGFVFSEYTVKSFVVAQDIIDVSKDRKEEIDKCSKGVAETKEYREQYIKLILDSAKKHENILFLVKLHPTEMTHKKIRNYYKSFFSEAKNVMLILEPVPCGLLLAEIDTLFHYGSTVGLESYIYMVPTVLIKKDKLTRSSQFTIAGMEYYESTVSVDIDNNECIDEFLKNLVKYRKAESVNKILNDILNYDIDQNCYEPSKWIADFIVGEKSINSIRLDSRFLKSKREKMNYIREELKNLMMQGNGIKEKIYFAKLLAALYI